MVLKDINSKQHPAELDPEYARQEEISKKMIQASKSMQRYITNRDVMKALRRMGKTMQKFKTFM